MRVKERRQAVGWDLSGTLYAYVCMCPDWWGLGVANVACLGDLVVRCWMRYWVTAKRQLGLDGKDRHIVLVH